MTQNVNIMMVITRVVIFIVFFKIILEDIIYKLGNATNTNRNIGIHRLKANEILIE